MFTALYVSLPSYLTGRVCSPTGRSTGTSTVPFSFVVAFTCVPSGSVMVTGAFGIGLLVSGSTSVMLTVVFPSVVFPGTPVISLSRPATSTGIVSLLLS